MLWRIHLKTDCKNGSTRSGMIDYCIKNNLVGIGWPIKSQPQTPDDYINDAREEYRQEVSSIRFVKDLKEGDLIWTKNQKGEYFLGKITGSWYYSMEQRHIDFDIPNLRKCIWLPEPVGTSEAIPGTIVNAFNPRRSLQKIGNGKDFAAQFSEYLYDPSKSPLISASEGETNSQIFFKTIGAEECEDIVGLYLQSQGYLLVPSTNKKYTSAYEFVLIHKERKTTAIVQVKQGKIDLNAEEFTETADEIFLFSTEGKIKLENSNARKLTVDELYKYVVANKEVMPKTIRTWLDFINNFIK